MKIILILLFLTSCTLFKKAPQLSETSHEDPTWIYAPYDACNEDQQLCATGESRTYTGSDTQAKINLASIFEVQVKSNLEVSTRASQAFPWQSEVRQEVEHSLSESISQIMEAVQVKRHHKKDGLFFALASLDRNQASEIIGSRLSKIDDELDVLWKDRQRTNSRKIVRLYLEREKLNERYSIVRGTGRPAKMTYNDIVSWRETRPLAEPLSLRIGQAPEWLVEKLKSLLTESGFRIVKGETKQNLSLNVDSIKEFLNVEGFEKYTFSLNLTNTQNGEKKKVLTISETVTGRTQADALLKVRAFFNNYLEEHLSDLHLD